MGFVRERTDKSFPNGYNTAMGVVGSIKDPVTTEILLDFIESRRWRKSDPDLIHLHLRWEGFNSSYRYNIHPWKNLEKYELKLRQQPDLVLCQNCFELHGPFLLSL